MPIEIATLQPYISVVGALIAIVGVPILIAQVRQLQRSVRDGVHAAIYAESADFRAHLIEHPHLRKYFFEGTVITADHEDYDRVVTIAELVLNYLEHIVVLVDSFGRQNQVALEKHVSHTIANSPILRQRLTENRPAYSPALIRYFD